MTIWNIVGPEFTVTENWGAPKELCGFTLMLLKVLRIETGWPIVIHNAYETSGHSKNSQHYKKKAVDWHFATTVAYADQVANVRSILQQFQMADSVGFGIYPFWNTPGFHTDSRGTKARWAYNKDGKMISFEEGLVLCSEL